MKQFLFTSITIMSWFLLFGQDDVRTGIIYGGNHAYSLTAPDGIVTSLQANKINQNNNGNT
jgi:hypothetical protein